MVKDIKRSTQELETYWNDEIGIPVFKLAEYTCHELKGPDFTSLKRSINKNDDAKSMLYYLKELVDQHNIKDSITLMERARETKFGEVSNDSRNF